ncbi:MAG: CDP-diacylglycerol--glycerol-3-phosphate 3-phosphatidyltransferase [Eubacteriales bacterium]|nr:CDP-diacylglycerol--glycerol-3-phosphate 3-phosphatidyltransferase [Eubacteriales bacterium]
MNLPNKLTILRIILVPFVLVFMLPIPSQSPAFAGWNAFIMGYGQIIALVIFIAASLTDLLDGAIARSQNLVTNLGKFLDPIADKMLVISVLIALVQNTRIHALVAIVIIIREFMVTGIRLLASDHGVVIAAGKLGKLKTVTQIIAISLMMVEGLVLMLLEPVVPTLADNLHWVGDGAMLIAVIMTIISGYDYIKRNLHFLHG